MECPGPQHSWYTPTVSLAVRHTICDVSGERLQPGGVRAEPVMLSTLSYLARLAYTLSGKCRLGWNSWLISIRSCFPRGYQQNTEFDGMEDTIALPNETCKPKRIVAPTVTLHPFVPLPVRQDVGSYLFTNLSFPSGARRPSCSS